MEAEPEADPVTLAGGKIVTAGKALMHNASFSSVEPNLSEALQSLVKTAGSSTGVKQRELRFLVGELQDILRRAKGDQPELVHLGEELVDVGQRTSLIALATNEAPPEKAPAESGKETKDAG